MQDYQKEIDLINRLLKLESDRRPANQRTAYERGYLTGLLASIAHSDALVKRELLEKINYLSKK